MDREMNESIIMDSDLMSERYMSQPSSVETRKSEVRVAKHQRLVDKFVNVTCKILRIPSKKGDESFDKKLRDVLLILIMSFMSIFHSVLFGIMLWLRIAHSVSNWVSIPAMGTQVVLSMLTLVFSIIIKVRKWWFSIFYVILGTICCSVSIGADTNEFYSVFFYDILLIYLALAMIMWQSKIWLIIIYFGLLALIIVSSFIVKIVVMAYNVDGDGDVVVSETQLYIFGISNLITKITSLVICGLLLGYSVYSTITLRWIVGTITRAIKSSDYDPDIKRALQKTNFVSEVGDVFGYIKKYRAFVPKHLLVGLEKIRDGSDDSDDSADSNSSDDSRIKVGFVQKNATVVCLQIENLLKEENSSSFDEVMGIHTRVVSTCEKICEELNGHIISITEKKVYCGFGIVQKQTKHYQDACKFSIKLRTFLNALNTDYLSDSLAFITFSIGIQSGNVLTGVVGSKTNKVNRVFGECKKIAAKLVDFGLYTGVQIVIGETTAEILPNGFISEPLDYLHFPRMHRKSLFKVYSLEGTVEKIKSNWMVSMMQEVDAQGASPDSMSYSWRRMEEGKFEESLEALKKLKMEKSNMYKFVLKLQKEGKTMGEYQEQILKGNYEYSTLIVPLINRREFMIT